MQKYFFYRPTYPIFSDRYRKQTISFFRPKMGYQGKLTTKTPCYFGLSWPLHAWRSAWQVTCGSAHFENNLGIKHFFANFLTRCRFSLMNSSPSNISQTSLMLERYHKKMSDSLGCYRHECIKLFFSLEAKVLYDEAVDITVLFNLEGRKRGEWCGLERLSYSFHLSPRFCMMKL